MTLGLKRKLFGTTLIVGLINTFSTTAYAGGDQDGGDALVDAYLEHRHGPAVVHQQAPVVEQAPQAISDPAPAVVAAPQGSVPSAAGPTIVIDDLSGAFDGIFDGLQLPFPFKSSRAVPTAAPAPQAPSDEQVARDLQRKLNEESAAPAASEPMVFVVSQPTKFERNLKDPFGALGRHFAHQERKAARKAAAKAAQTQGK